MTTSTPFQLGSISIGTLRLEDLTNNFGCALEQFQGITIPAGIDGYQDGGEEYTQSELLQMYTELLESVCPPFVYFGAHSGDGADFGFWVDWDDLDEAIRLASNYQGKNVEQGLWLSDDTVFVHQNALGTTVGDAADGRILWSTV